MLRRWQHKVQRWRVWPAHLPCLTQWIPTPTASTPSRPTTIHDALMITTRSVVDSALPSSSTSVICLVVVCRSLSVDSSSADDEYTFTSVVRELCDVMSVRPVVTSDLSTARTQSQWKCTVSALRQCRHIAAQSYDKVAYKHVLYWWLWPQ